MYLKQLQMIGFKSFPEKTSLEFISGVTAIVGPNGCGKSNVCDAIRWVLGEQSAKALRGGEMADVIFNGADSRKPLSMAEVSLTFSGCKDVLKTGALANLDINFDEVTVSRRIFRDGHGEYLINKTPCRLKDVHSLFMDTGIGRSSYSIMEQGKIDMILSSRPEDRRAIFEEAAGITKYKSQKKEALRKLEYTEANLLRVGDILQEVKRQMNSLHRQANKARRYQEMMQELSKLDTTLARHDYDQLTAEIRGLERDQQGLLARIEDARIEINSSEGAIHEQRASLDKLEGDIQNTIREQSDVQGQIDRDQDRITVHHERIREAESSIQLAEKEMTGIREEHHRSNGELQKLLEHLRTANDTLAASQASLDAAQHELAESERAHRAHAELRIELQGRILDCDSNLANLRSQLASLEKQKKQAADRRKELEQEQVRWLHKQEEQKHRIESMNGEILSFQTAFSQNKDTVQGTEENLRKARHEVKQLQADLVESQKHLAEKSSRLEVLRQLEAAYEGYSEGAQAVIRKLSDAGSAQAGELSRMVGTLASLIDVDPKFALAIEAALGTALEVIIVRNQHDAMELLQQLRQENLGRASFALPFSLPMPQQYDLPLGGLIFASHAIRPAPEVEALTRHLLGDTVIVESLEKALQLRATHPSFAFVTLDGEIVSEMGIVTGGSHTAASFNLLERRNEIHSLGQEVRHLEDGVSDLSRQKGEWEARLNLFEQSLDTKRDEARSSEVMLAEKNGELKRLQNESGEISSRVGIIQREIAGLDQQASHDQASMEQLSTETTTESETREGLSLRLKDLDRDIAVKERDVEARRLSAGDARVEFGKKQEFLAGLETQRSTLEQQVAGLDQNLSNRLAQVKDLRARIVQWNGEIAACRERVRGKEASCDSIEARRKTLVEEKQAMVAKIEEQEHSVEDLRQKLEALQGEGHQIDLRISKQRIECDNLVQRIFSQYHVDLRTTPPSVEQAATEAEPNWEEIQARVVELRSKLEAAGPVNLEAVKEYDELQERHSFINKEFEDLNKAKGDLHEIITRINKTTKELFSDTFEKVRANFQQVFGELFGGGKANLLLLDETDPLECGIEIVAKPPGKQLTNISLLSGGEKTMTAVALLFAIYMVKPSPFCVLDEMDAPLDESNIGRFIKMLQRFLHQSQFLLITHNKKTIAIADVIYGVTMEEPGVSKHVSVKFTTDEEHTRRQALHKAGESEPEAVQQV
jgi:chromosome segregation protein